MAFSEKQKKPFVILEFSWFLVFARRSFCLVFSFWGKATFLFCTAIAVMSPNF